MKVSEVPQDKGYLIEGRISDLNYAIDNDGRYTSRQSRGWKPKNEAIKFAWDQVYEHAGKLRQQILDGILSPIALYMELNLMDISILAGYTGISKRKVRKHLRMKEFLKLPKEMIDRYAEALNITAEDLVNIGKIREFKYED
ncbi:MAG TPA: hypothetical protein PKL65_13880 [Bacteroidales bacterium]|jgi:hypothetical protein|nr:hypothetical protein [Bacteroidales bacterium]HPM18978.1 hypothetical protein [Bacteroidales bacterium]HQG77105.1 hypothetical protein [Bacteroidales bacterium]